MAGEGTSPRVRGKRRRASPSAPPSGYIPACAGEAYRWGRLSAPKEVHPRVCGGSNSTTPPKSGRSGTSPRVRGKLGVRLPIQLQRRYIPACAGEAGAIAPDPPVRTVHPRVCGGSSRGPRAATPGAGTSPRVRGKRGTDRLHRSGLRYIPACAGEAWWRTRGWTSTSVHPRVCGGSSALTR